MAVLLRFVCPIDGLELATRNVTGQHKTRMEDNSVREHDTYDVNQPFTCAGGHTWNFAGSIDTRISPSYGLMGNG